MTLYLVHGNTYLNDCYGHKEHMFGVYTTLAQAEAAKIAVEKKYKEKMETEDDPDLYYGHPEDIEFQILELKADELVDVYLGGFAE